VDTLGAMLLTVCILAATVGVLMVLAVWSTRRNGGVRRRRRARVWRRLLPGVLDGRRYPRMRLQKTLRTARDLRLFDDFLAGELKKADRETFLALRHVSRSLGVTDHLHRQLGQSRSLWKRALAARGLGLLRERDARDKIAGLLEARDPTVVMVAGYACASLQDPTLVMPVLRAVYGKTSITLHGMADMLSRFGPGICPTVHEVLASVVEQHTDFKNYSPVSSGCLVDQEDVSAQVILIDLLGFFRYRAASTTLLSLLDLTPQEEVQAHVIKALVRTGSRGAAARLTALLSHPNWVVRSQAALALGTLGTPDALPQLTALLEDEDHWVRAHARSAVTSLSSARPALEA
jgi:hypothetical protein